MKKYILKTALFVSLCAAFVFAAQKPASASEGVKATLARVIARLEPAIGFRPRVSLGQEGPGSAFVMPDGTIVISPELISTAASEDEVAFILAHESAHILATDQVPGKILELAGHPGISSSQIKELKADAQAVRIMRQAGYKPEASLAILKRLSAKGAGLDQRIRALSRLLDIK